VIASKNENHLFIAIHFLPHALRTDREFFDSKQCARYFAASDKKAITTRHDG
jgi:hypothetical protein